MKKNLIFTAVLCVALVFGFVSCENPDDDKFGNSTEQSGDKDTSSDNEQNGNGTPDPDEGEDNSSDNEQNGEGTPKPETPTPNPYNGYEWVDLGLPSGLKWATCNVGANKPKEYGNYYAWGEVEPKEVYDWSTYFDITDGGTTFLKYNNESGKTTLDPEDDAAAVNMGGSWRMPTIEELQELIAECTWTWTTLNDVNGYNVEGPNGNAIFLPAAGYRYYSDLSYAGSDGGYWSSSLFTDYSNNACNLDFYSDGVGWGGDVRCYGHSVRGVFSR